MLLAPSCHLALATRRIILWVGWTGYRDGDSHGRRLDSGMRPPEPFRTQDAEPWPSSSSKSDKPRRLGPKFRIAIAELRFPFPRRGVSR